MDLQAPDRMAPEAYSLPCLPDFFPDRRPAWVDYPKGRPWHTRSGLHDFFHFLPYPFPRRREIRPGRNPPGLAGNVGFLNIASPAGYLPDNQINPRLRTDGWRVLFAHHP